MSKKALYVDVTQLVHWQGYVAGIPRVMYELSKRFKDTENYRIVHVSWVKEVGKFCEIDFFATMDKLGKGIVYIKDGNDSTPGKNHTSSVKRASFEVFRPIKRVAKKVIELAGLSDVALIKKAQNELASAEARTYKQVQFKKHDAIFIPWGEWWDEQFLQALENGVRDVDLKIIPVIHDVLPFTLAPQFSGHSTESLANYCRRIVPISALTLSVSKATQEDLHSWLKKQKIMPPPMEVFRLGEDFEFAKAEIPDDDNFKEAGLAKKDYIICVGTVEARKNHTLIYYVYKLAKSRGIDLPPIAIVGRRGWKTEQIYDFMTQDPEVKDKFVFLHNVSNEHLSWLFDHAKLSLAPSFCEGWGMPIAESVARGVPCACSNTTSMVEIAEGYVQHFSPASTDECLAAIVDMLGEKSQKKWRAKIKTYKQTTWDESYKTVRKKMQEVAHV